MKKKGQIAASAMVVSVLALAHSSFAAMEVESYGVPIALSVGNTQDLSFAGFNPSLGELTAVSIILDSTDTVESDVINYLELTAANPLPYTLATSTMTVTATALGGLTAETTSTAGPYSGTANAFYNIAGSTTAPATGSGLLTQDLSLYENGPFSLSVTATGNYAGSSAPGLFFGGSGSSTGTVEIDYTYATSQDTPVVPEPGTIFAGLAAVGLGGTGVARRLWRNRS